MRYISAIFLLAIFIVNSETGYCDWQDMIQVNTDNSGLQAPRDSDCPWSIAADGDGNVYAVWEDKRDYPYLYIYSRKKNADGSWEEYDELVSYEEGLTYGHPSVCVIPGGEEPFVLASYVVEASTARELRGNTYASGIWGNPSYFISVDGDYLLPNNRDGWGTNMVTLSDGRSYAFWQYAVSGDAELWFNEYDEGWTPEDERPVYDDEGYGTHYSRHENACVDEDDNIHLVYSDNKSGQNEIYCLSKKP